MHKDYQNDNIINKIYSQDYNSKKEFKFIDRLGRVITITTLSSVYLLGNISSIAEEVNAPDNREKTIQNLMDLPVSMSSIDDNNDTEDCSGKFTQCANGKINPCTEKVISCICPAGTYLGGG